MYPHARVHGRKFLQISLGRNARHDHPLDLPRKAAPRARGVAL
jgi:hypothetical protein